MNEQFLTADFDFPEHSDIGQRLQVNGRRLPVSQLRLDNVLDAAVRLNENQLDQFAAVDLRGTVFFLPSTRQFPVRRQACRESIFSQMASRVTASSRR
jgi:hypothetical protein